ncbi:MAG: hydroxymethylglutaryl-CoA lyase [Microscillaceae bacterium]|jgi:hydroxymethylglutaryl-CoA lyase|nr:hydroxymethylglutaryl-CoA lyase [Microscillaceae bacterium]
MLKLIECPRDAMQGLADFIPTELKAAYINQLLKVGFDTLDFGSFVSPKVIPQMRDTGEVLNQLNLSSSSTHLLAIVANLRGAEQALSFEEIAYLGYPLSISETFQIRNTNKTIAESLVLVEEMQNLCVQNNRTLVTYIAMGFGNPYNDPYTAETVLDFTQKLVDLDIQIISLADTVGVSNPENIKFLFETVIPQFPHIEFGAHLHSNPATTEEKIAAAYNAGCRRFDGAMLGFGGCPMAKDDLVGNIAMEKMIHYFQKKWGIDLALQTNEFAQAVAFAGKVFLH